MMLAECAEHFGVIRSEMARSSSSASALFNASNTRITLPIVLPLWSKATIVFSKVGFSGLLVIASISLLCSLMAKSMAGSKSDFAILSNGIAPFVVRNSFSNTFSALIVNVPKINRIKNSFFKLILL